MHDAQPRNSVNPLHLGLALFVLIWLNAGTFSYVSAAVPDAVKLGVFAIWLLLACRRNGYWQSLLVRLWPLMLFHVFAASAALFEDNLQLSILLRNVLYLYAVFSIFLYYVEERYSAERRIIVYALLIDYVYVAINTALQLQLNPQVARYLSAQSHVQEALLGSDLPLAIGNYAYFYSLVMLVAVLLYQGLGLRRRILSTIPIAAAAGVLIINAQFTIAIALLFVLVVAIVLLRLSSRGTGAIVITSALGIAMVGVSYLPVLLRWLAGLEDVPREVSVRLLEVAFATSGGGAAGGDLGLRLALYADSIRAFMSNVLFGTYGGIGVGRHSTIVDLLGMFGLFAVLFFWFCFGVFRFTRCRLRGKDRTFINLMWTYIIVLGLVNTVMFSPMFIALMVLVPFMLLTGETPNTQMRSADEGPVGYERADRGDLRSGGNPSSG